MDVLIVWLPCERCCLETESIVEMHHPQLTTMMDLHQRHATCSKSCVSDAHFTQRLIVVLLIQDIFL